MPSKTGVGYITVSGFVVTKAATTWAPPAAYQDGMIGPHWSKGWIIEDCEISNSKCAGISLGKYYDPENDHKYIDAEDFISQELCTLPEEFFVAMDIAPTMLEQYMIK